MRDHKCMYGAGYLNGNEVREQKYCVDAHSTSPEFTSLCLICVIIPHHCDRHICSMACFRWSVWWIHRTALESSSLISPPVSPVRTVCTLRQEHASVHSRCIHCVGEHTTFVSTGRVPLQIVGHASPNVVEVTHDYTAQKDDELTLRVGDTIQGAPHNRA